MSFYQYKAQKLELNIKHFYKKKISSQNCEFFTKIEKLKFFEILKTFKFSEIFLQFR